MQHLQAPNQSRQGTSPLLNDLPSSRSEPFSEADQFASRWEPDMFVAHAKYSDPYEAWLDERRFQRGAATGSAARGSAGRFDRNQPPKAPWDAILVTLSSDGP